MKTLIIAEAGVNHNGSLEMAFQMIEAAAKSGADIVKFQTFRAEDLVTATAQKAQYQKENDGDSSQFEMLKKLELSEQDYQRIMEKCQEENIGFMSTPFSQSAVDLLQSTGMKLWKIPSGEITNLPLLRKIAKVGDTIVMSTGMATLEEVRQAMTVLLQSGALREKIHLMHCTTAYPTPIEDVNLKAINVLKTLDPAGVGYSDHTTDLMVPAIAVAMGASMIEKHFTLDRNLPGPDHKASLLPDEFAQMVKNIRKVEKALGKEEKRPVGVEIPNISVARKSIVAARIINKGDFFTEDNLTCKRPGTGVSPMNWDLLLGRKSKHDYATDEEIQPDELQD